MKPDVEVKNIHKSFGNKPVLRDVTFEVNNGEVVAIIGPSGSGKSTLLRCINYLTPLDGGEIIVNGVSVTPNFNVENAKQLRENIGMVFQQYNLWPHMTVLQNLIEAPMVVKNIDKNTAIEKAKVLLEKVSLSNKANEYPGSLSGGQQQRVAIARALMMDSGVLLLDEITSALDPELSVEVLNVIKKITQEFDKTTLMVTHEIGFAKHVADKVVFIDDGRIIEQGKPSEIFVNPKVERTKNFLDKVLAFDI